MTLQDIQTYQKNRSTFKKLKESVIKIRRPCVCKFCEICKTNKTALFKDLNAKLKLYGEIRNIKKNAMAAKKMEEATHFEKTFKDVAKKLLILYKYKKKLKKNKKIIRLHKKKYKKKFRTFKDLLLGKEKKRKNKSLFKFNNKIDKIAKKIISIRKNTNRPNIAKLLPMQKILRRLNRLERILK